jgi:hypothetical protein
MHVGDEKCIKKFGWKKRERREHFRESGMNGRRILKDTGHTGNGNVIWTDIP